MTEDNFYNLTAYGDSQGDRVHKALSVLHYAEIQEILKNNKTLLRLMNYGNGGHAYVPGMGAELYDKDGIANISLNIDPEQLLDLGDESAANIVSIRGAKIIDLTGNGVTSASNLKELWEDVSEAQLDAGYRRMIKVSLVFNDKYNDDDFRDVYALIITSAKEKDIYDYVDARPAEEEVDKITAVIELEDLEIGPDGATYTVDIDEDGNPIEGTEVVTMSRAAKKAIGTLTITFNGNGKITDVTIEYKPDVDSDKVVVAVKITVGAEELEQIPVGAEEIPDVTVENFTPVAVAEVGADGKITGIKYNTAKAGDAPLKLVDKDGNEIGAVTVTPNEEDPTAEPDIKVTIDNEKAEDAGIEVPAEGETIPVVGVDEEGNEGEPVEVEPVPEEPSPDEPVAIGEITISGIPDQLLTDEDPTADYAAVTAEAAEGEVEAEIAWTEGEGAWDYEITLTVADAEANCFDESTSVADHDDADVTVDLDAQTITVTGSVPVVESYTWTVSIAATEDAEAEDVTGIEDGADAEIAITAAAGKVITGVTAPDGVEIETVPEDITEGVKNVTVTVKNVTANVELVVTTDDSDEPAEYTISVSGDGIEDVDDTTFTEGGTEPVEIEIDAAYDSVITGVTLSEETAGNATMAALTIPAEGAKSVTVSLTGIIGNVELVVATEEAAKATLILGGDLISPASVVWYRDMDIGRVTGEELTQGGKTYMTYEVFADTPVVITNETSITESATTFMTTEGEDGVSVEVKADGDAHEITLTLAAGATLKILNAPTSASGMHAIYFNDGITPVKLYGSANKLFEGNDKGYVYYFPDITDEDGIIKETNVWYVPASLDAKFMTLNLGDYDYAYRTSVENNEAEAASNKAHSRETKNVLVTEPASWDNRNNTSALTDVIEFYGDGLSEDVYIYAANKVTLKGNTNDATIKPECLGWGYDNESHKENDQVYYVRVGTKIAVDLTVEGVDYTGVIASADGTDLIGTDISGELTVREDVTLLGAYKVEAENGIIVKAAAKGTASADEGTTVTSGKYVVAGSVIGAYSTGTTQAVAIDAAEEIWAADVFGNAVTLGADLSIKKAVEITMGDTSYEGSANIFLRINGKSVATTTGNTEKSIYVVPGDATYTAMATSAEVGDTVSVSDNAAAVTPGEEAGATGSTETTFQVTEMDDEPILVKVVANENLVSSDDQA